MSFGDDERLRTELDFQFLLPERKSSHDQSIRTKENEKIDGIHRANSESDEFFSAPDESESPRKRLHVD